MKKQSIAVTKIFNIVIFILILGQVLPFSLTFEPSLIGTADGTKAEYYSFTLNSTKTEQTTDGKYPVEYVITITNLGNHVDTFKIYAELVEVTGCSKPDVNEWSYGLGTTLITLQPSQSTPIILTVSTSCGCQIGCRATITVHGISSGDSSLKKSIITYTTRGQAKKVSGLVTEIDFNPDLNPLYLDTTMKFDVYIYNVQNQQESVIVWATEGPEEWLLIVSPDEFSMMPNSKQIITLSFRIPRNITIGIYSIALTAQSINYPSVQGKDRIQIQIKPDIIISNVTFSNTPIYAGEKIEINIEVKNNGLASATEVPITVYNDLNISTDHELIRDTLQSIQPGHTANIIIPWQPHEGEYNIVIWVNPNDTFAELRNDNNLRIEPVIVEKAREKVTTDDFFYFTFFLILGLIFIWLIIYYKFSRKNHEPAHKRNTTLPKRDQQRQLAFRDNVHSPKSKLDRKK